MLHIFRSKHVARFVLWGILILVLPSFVLFGTESFTRSGKKGASYAGIINGRKVGFSELNESIVAVRSQLILNYWSQPDILRQIENNRPLLARLAWERLILLKEAKRERFNSADADIASYIKNHPLFVRNGKFDDRIYDYILQHNVGLSPRTFEEIVRQNLEINQLRLKVTKDITATDADARAAFEEEQGKADIQYVLFALADYGDQTDEARQACLGAAERAATDLRGRLSGGETSFADACREANLTVRTSDFFSLVNSNEGLSQALGIWDMVLALNQNGVSDPIDIGDAYIVATNVKLQTLDERSFEEKKAEYRAMAQNKKRLEAFDQWLFTVSSSSTLKIDLNKIDDYIGNR